MGDGTIKQLLKVLAVLCGSTKDSILIAYVFRILSSFSLTPSDLRPDLPLFLGR